MCSFLCTYPFSSISSFPKFSLLSKNKSPTMRPCGAVRRIRADKGSRPLYSPKGPQPSQRRGCGLPTQ